MDPEVSQRLLQLNRQFYQTFAVQFSATRQRLQPGVRRIIDSLPNPARILDLGCGNGEFARVLAEGGQRGTYIGLDSSAELLQIATPASSAEDFEIHFYQADLSTPGWESAIAGQTFDVICAFAVLHHIPGDTLRQQLITQMAARLAPNGLFIHSEWQFLNSPRLRARIQDWQTVGLSETQVDADDYLLDWRSGGSGLRYVHHFSSAELKQLAERTGFQIQTEFSSDGEGNQLGFYQIWKAMQ
jgi:SAM-dependent methyltransferase